MMMTMTMMMMMMMMMMMIMMMTSGSISSARRSIPPDQQDHDSAIGSDTDDFPGAPRVGDWWVTTWMIAQEIYPQKPIIPLHLVVMNGVYRLYGKKNGM